MIDLALDSKVFIDNVLDAALQEIDIVFNTENTELINNPTYGTNFEQFLWTLTPSPNELTKYIYDKLEQTYFLSTMTYDVNVDVIRGEYRAIYLVQVIVKDDDGNTGIRQYQFR